MRILHLISSSGMFGAERVLLNIGIGLRDKNHAAYLLCLRDSKKGVPEIHFEARRAGLASRVIFCDGRMDVKALFEIKNFMKTENIDVIHSHGYKSDIYGFIASKMSGKPIISTLHGWTGETFNVRLYERLDRWVIRRMDHLVPVAPSIMDKVTRMGLNGGRVTFIPNGIDTVKFNPIGGETSLREEFGFNGHSVVIGTVGRLSREKDHSSLIGAFGRVSLTCPDVRLLIVGEGDLKDELRSKAQSLGVGKKIVFAGFRSDMVSIYKSMDIFVLPSLTEGLPLVLLETMSMGLPVIASQVGGIPYVINKNAGIMIPPASPEILEEALRCLVNDESLRKEFGRNARERISSSFSLDSFCKKYIDLYEDLKNNGN